MNPLKSQAALTSQAKYPFICFDVFDTLLTRMVGNPNDIFLLLGRRLLLTGQISCSAEVFAWGRLHAEERANQIQGCHPTLEHIYRELVRALGLPADAATSLVEAELDLERTLSRRLPDATSLIADARQSGAAVIFITDTNMSSVFIRELLANEGLCVPKDQIFASCECRVDKARGLLFPHVSHELCVGPRSLLHNGNDAVADLRNGKLSGWNVRYLPTANLNRYERALASQANATGGLSSLLAGASRMARLCSHDAPQTITSVSAGVMAPILVAWMIWTMRQAQRDGCKRLYFVSRDGQVLLDVARRLEPALRTGLDLRYLYTSRQAMQLGGWPEPAFRDLLRLQYCRMFDVAEFLGVEPAALAPLLTQELRDTSSWNSNLSQAHRAQLLALLGMESFQVIFRRQSDQSRALLQDYLSQEGWGNGVPFGMVDVGWRASLAGILPPILQGSSLHSPHRFYFFGLSSGAHCTAGADNVNKLEAWHFDASSVHGYLPFPPSTSSLMEMFCAGDHGAVIGFKREGSKVIPILRTPTSPMQDWGLAAMRHITAAFVDSFAATLLSAPDLVDIHTDLRRPIQKVMELFWLRPTAAEVRDWGSFPVEVNMNNSIVLPIAERVGFRQFSQVLKSRKLSFRSEHSWPSGTAESSSWPYRALLKTLWRLRADAPRMRRRLQWLRARLGLAERK